jgi:hypothetical protein
VSQQVWLNKDQKMYTLNKGLNFAALHCSFEWANLEWEVYQNATKLKQK